MTKHEIGVKKEEGSLLAGAVRRVEDLVVENGEVERQAEADGVCGWQVNCGDVIGRLVGRQALFGRLLPVAARGELRQVPVVVPLPKKRSKGESFGLFNTLLRAPSADLNKSQTSAHLFCIDLIRCFSDFKRILNAALHYPQASQS